MMSSCQKKSEMSEKESDYNKCIKKCETTETKGDNGEWMNNCKQNCLNTKEGNVLSYQLQ